MRKHCLFWAAAAICAAQSTKVDLPTQSVRPDFSAMAHTRPAAVGSVLPGNCSVGELFFNTASPSGQNLYACVATNTWALEGGGSGSGVLIAVDSGAANAYAGCPGAGVSTLSNGLLILLQAASTNTGSSTFNLCGLGAKPVQTAYGASLSAGMIQISSGGSPGFALLSYSSNANGGNGAWENLSPGQVQLAPQSAQSVNQVPRATGQGQTNWVSEMNPGDGRIRRFVQCNGQNGDLSNSGGMGAAWGVLPSGGSFTTSASAGSGTQYPFCTITTGAANGNFGYYGTANNTLLWVTGRSLWLDTTAAVSSTSNIRNWIGFAAAPATLAGQDTPTAAFVGFRYSTGAGDSSWRCIIANGSAATNVDSGVIPTTNQVHFKIITDDTNSAVHFYVNSLEVCSGTAFTNYPPATGVEAVASVTTLTGAARGLNLAYLWTESDK